MKFRKSQALPQIGDLYAKAGTSGLLWVVHRMLPNIDPAVPHVELLRLGDTSTRVTISLPALVDIRMFEPVEKDGSHDHHLAAMGLGRASASDEPSAAARDADRAEAQAEADEAADAEDGADADTDVDPGDENEDTRITRLYPQERADDALESLERIDDLPADAADTATPEPPRGGVPEDAAVPAFDPDVDPDAHAAAANAPAANAPAYDAPDDDVDDTAEETGPAPERDPATDDLFGHDARETDDFDRMIAAADPDRAAPVAEDAGADDDGAGDADEDTDDEPGPHHPREH